MQTEEYEKLKKIGKDAYECIAEMVAAMECDYERLEELRDERDSWEPEEIPDDFEVTPLDDDDDAEDKVTCGACGRSWDDSIPTSYTPAPSGRCPFEDWHDLPRTWAEANPDEAEELAELEEAAGDCTDEGVARERIEEDALSVQIRSGWYSPGEEPQPEEFEILLSTGGPATRIIGELDEYRQPIRARLQAQDWFTAWTDYLDADQDVLLNYARCFYFGD